MHPEFSQMTLHEHQRELDQRVAGGVRSAQYGARARGGASGGRRAAALHASHDDAALERLAILDGRPLPRGRYVVAEVDGDVVAAISLVSGGSRSPTRSGRRRTCCRCSSCARGSWPRTRRSRGLPLWSTVRGGAGAQSRACEATARIRRHDPSARIPIRTYAALLRGINVGGARKVSMAGARRSCSPRSATEVAHLHPERERRLPDRRERSVDRAGARGRRSTSGSGSRTRVLLRTHAELEAVAAGIALRRHERRACRLPRPEARRRPPSKRSTPTAHRATASSVAGREIYLSLANGAGRTKLTLD